MWSCPPCTEPCACMQHIETLPIFPCILLINDMFTEGPTPQQLPWTYWSLPELNPQHCKYKVTLSVAMLATKSQFLAGGLITLLWCNRIPVLNLCSPSVIPHPKSYEHSFHSAFCTLYHHPATCRHVPQCPNHLCRCHPSPQTAHHHWNGWGDPKGELPWKGGWYEWYAPPLLSIRCWWNSIYSGNTSCGAASSFCKS